MVILVLLQLSETKPDVRPVCFGRHAVADSGALYQIHGLLLIKAGHTLTTEFVKYGLETADSYRFAH